MFINWNFVVLFVCFMKNCKIGFDVIFLCKIFFFVKRIFFIFGENMFVSLLSDKFFFIVWILLICFNIFFFGKNVFWFVNVDFCIN